jgi:PadR family transcriptional regulator PadR
MTKKSKQQIPTLGEFEVYVLSAIIAAGDDAYGVRIHEGVEEFTSRDIAQGAVYTTLMRLEEKGLIKSRLGETTPERGGRAKRFYTVEAPGQRALRSVLKSIHRASRAVTLVAGMVGMTGGSHDGDSEASILLY